MDTCELTQCLSSSAADAAVVDDAVPGSPFQFTVGPVKTGGAHKVVAVGEGLQSAVVSQPGTTFMNLIFCLLPTSPLNTGLQQCVRDAVIG